MKLYVRQEWVDLKNTIFTNAVDGQRVQVLMGTSGRGNSSFVYYFLCSLLVNEKRLRKSLDSNEPLVAFVEDSDNSIVTNRLLSLAGCTRVNSFGSFPDYFVADVHHDHSQPPSNCRLSLIVGENLGWKALKAISDEGLHMLISPTREEMHCIWLDKGLTREEINFRLDVVGCNPTAVAMNNLRFTFPNIYPGFYQVFQEVWNEVVVVDRSFAGSVLSRRCFDWALGVIMKHESAGKASLENLLREYDRNFDLIHSSTFLCFLVGRLVDSYRNDKQHHNMLNVLFGRSAWGCHPERYRCHEFFLGLFSHHSASASTTKPFHPCWSYREERWIDLQVGDEVDGCSHGLCRDGGRPHLAMFRDIPDISRALLTGKPYLETTSSGLVIDAIIPKTSMVLQVVPYSTSARGVRAGSYDFHRAMDAIRTELGNPDRVILIFVVRECHIAMFKFPSDVPHYVDMYVTVGRALTTEKAETLMQDRPVELKQSCVLL